MKNFKSIEIKDSEENLNIIASRLKDWKKVFTYKPRLSSTLDNNFFVKPGYAICMKTDRIKLHKASVWIIRYQGAIKVINIVANNQTKKGGILSLSINEYNMIMDIFYNEVIKHVKTDNSQIILTDEEVEMSDIMSKQSLTKFNAWRNSCNADYPISFEGDRELFFDFVYSLSEDDNIDFDEDKFKQILNDNNNRFSEKNIELIATQIQFALDLLYYIRRKKYEQ